MDDQQPLVITSSPHITGGGSVARLMYSVVIALLPATAVGIAMFGWDAVATILWTVGFCLAIEALLGPWSQPGRSARNVLADGSGLVAGLLLALNLPPASPWWLCAIGAAIAIGLTKHVFGGLGRNIFNPAIVARVALLIAFPVHMTAWRLPLAPVDAVTSATPLGALKTDGARAALEAFPLWKVYVGAIPGSLGEISAIALILGGLFLLIRRVISWEIPVAYMVTLGAITLVPWLADPAKYASPLFHLGAGGVMLGVWFMATDLVTSPINPRGMLVYGAGCGALTALIRLAGSYPEGTAFAILIMNALTPLIERWTRPVPVGRRAARAKKEES